MSFLSLETIENHLKLNVVKILKLPRELLKMTDNIFDDYFDLGGRVVRFLSKMFRYVKGFSNI